MRKKQSKKLVNLVLTIIFLILSSGIGFSFQEMPTIVPRSDVDSIFQQGVILYNNGNYNGALAQFRKLLSQNMWHQRTTSALFMHAKSAVRTGKLDMAERSIQQLIHYFPSSRYVEFARVELGVIQFLRADYFSAARHFLWAVDFARNNQVKEEAGEYAQITLNDYLTINELKRIRTETAGSRGLAMVIGAEALRLSQAGEKGAARTLVENFIKQNPGGDQVKYLRDVLRSGRKQRSGGAKIGIILPLSGQFGREGNGVLEGIRYSLAQSKSKKNIDLELVIKDSESNIVKAIKYAQEFSDDPDVICIIGEVENFISAAIAGVAQENELPVIAPVASDNGIAEIGDYIFQTNPTLGAQSRALARYAVDSLGFRTFVTLAPQDEYGHQMVDAFSEEVDKLGAEIMTQRWYYGVPEKLGGQFRDIREVAFRRALEDTLKQSLPNFTSLNKDSLWNRYNTQVMLNNDLKEDIVHSSGHFPVKNIDAVFFPVYSEDIEYIARQFAYFNIQAQILGGDYWFLTDLDKSKTFAKYVDGTIFPSGYYYDDDDFTYRLFRNEFRKARRVTPKKWELFGYDAMDVVLSTIEDGAQSRLAIRNRLGSGTHLRGKKGYLYLDKNSGANRSVNILQIQNNNIKRLMVTDKN